MTTDTSPESPAADLRRWAHGHLGLVPETSPDVSRRAVLIGLAQHGFTPPLGWHSALRASGILPAGEANFGLDNPALLPARRAWEESLREEIEAFAAEFFSLDVADRIGHFGDLAERCRETPALLARLVGLRAGLELPSQPPSGMPASMRELVKQARELFVRRPHARAARRTLLLRRSGSLSAQWQADALRLQRLFPTEAALEPALIKELTSGPDREKRRKRAHRKRLARRSVVVRSSRRLSSQFWWPAVGIFSIVLGALLGFFDNGRHVQTPARDQRQMERDGKAYARQLMERSRRGERLSEQERALLKAMKKIWPSLEPFSTFGDAAPRENDKAVSPNPKERGNQPPPAARLLRDL